MKRGLTVSLLFVYSCLTDATVMFTALPQPVRNPIFAAEIKFNT